MNDANTPASSETSIPDNTQLVQLHDEAAAAVSAPDLHERVRELTARVLHERRMALNDIRELVAAISSGVGSGLTARGGEMKDGLKQAIGGLDEAVGSAAQAASYTLREAATQGKAFKDNELKASLEQLRDLEAQIVDALKQTASQSGGKLKEELGYLIDHMKHSGTRTGEQVREALQQTGERREGQQRCGASRAERVGQHGHRAPVPGGKRHPGGAVRFAQAAERTSAFLIMHLSPAAEMLPGRRLG